MKISTEICSLSRRIGEVNALKMYIKAGFDAFDLSLFDMAHIDWQNHKVIKINHPFENESSALDLINQLKNIALKNNVICNQSHAPYPSDIKEVADKLPDAIRYASICGAPYIVIHPLNDYNAEQNRDFYNSLLPYAKKYNIKIALENMWNWDNNTNEALPAACSHHDDFLKHISLLDNNYFVCCLDIGHAEMRGLSTDAVTMIKTLKNHLKCLHIHDNDKHYDSHELPFTMNIDFEKIIDALVEINYDGDITLEADRYLANFKDDELENGVKNMYNVACKLREMFINKKNKK